MKKAKDMKKSNNIKQTSKRQSRRKVQKVLGSILLVLILITALLGGIWSITNLREVKHLDMSWPYEYVEPSADLSTDADVQIAPSFASDICVVSADKGMEGIVLIGSNERAALFDVDGKDSMYAVKAHEKAYPASITKIMTAILAIKYGDMNELVTISQNAVTLEEGSQRCGFIAGDMVTMDELFHGLLVYSGNDAANAIAENIGGSVENFVKMMNEELRSIGATNSHFTNPHGLHSEEHYTTAYDIYLMLNEALKYPYFVDVMQLGMYSLTFTRGEEKIAKTFEATDRYLTGEVFAPTGVKVLGGKTGTTSQAGACLAILSQNEYGKPYVSVVLTAPTKAVLYQDMNQLLEKIN